MCYIIMVEFFFLKNNITKNERINNKSIFRENSDERKIMNFFV